MVEGELPDLTKHDVLTEHSMNKPTSSGNARLRLSKLKVDDMLVDFDTIRVGSESENEVVFDIRFNFAELVQNEALDLEIEEHMVELIAEGLIVEFTVDKVNSGPKALSLRASVLLNSIAEILKGNLELEVGRNFAYLPELDQFVLTNKTTQMTIGTDVFLETESTYSNYRCTSPLVFRLVESSSALLPGLLGY